MSISQEYNSQGLSISSPLDHPMFLLTWLNPRTTLNCIFQIQLIYRLIDSIKNVVAVVHHMLGPEITQPIQNPEFHTPPYRPLQTLKYIIPWRTVATINSSYFFLLFSNLFFLFISSFSAYFTLICAWAECDSDSSVYSLRVHILPPFPLLPL